MTAVVPPIAPMLAPLARELFRVGECSSEQAAHGGEPVATADDATRARFWR